MKYILGLVVGLIFISNSSCATSTEVTDEMLNSSFANSIWSWITIIISMLTLILSIVIFRKEQIKAKSDILELKTHPPMDKNSAEVEYICRGFSSGRGVMSLLIYLANKGYIKIKPEVETKMLVKQPGFRITKLKEYDGNDENEKKFMEGLFKNRKAINSKAYELMKENKEIGQTLDYEGYENSFKRAEQIYSSESFNEVTYYDLNNCFYKVSRNIREDINSRGTKERKKIITKSQLIIYFFALTIFVLSTIMLTHKVFPEGDDWMATYLVAGIFGLPVVLISHKEIMDKHNNVITSIKKHKSNKKFMTIWLGGVLALIAYILLYAYGEYIPSTLETISVIFSFIAVFIEICCSQKISIPNDISSLDDDVKNILGFVKFIENADRSNLEKIQSENLNYCYDIYPYAYSLGITEKWEEKFKNVVNRAPEWCEGFENFDIHEFNAFIHMAIELARND